MRDYKRKLDEYWDEDSAACPTLRYSDYRLGYVRGAMYYQQRVWWVWPLAGVGIGSLAIHLLKWVVPHA